MNWPRTVEPSPGARAAFLEALDHAPPLELRRLVSALAEEAFSETMVGLFATTRQANADRWWRELAGELERMELRAMVARIVGS